MPLSKPAFATSPSQILTPKTTTPIVKQVDLADEDVVEFLDVEINTGNLR